MTSEVQKCCVPSCKSIASDCWFYEFPEDDNLYETWIKQCGLNFHDNFMMRDDTQFICSAHFDVTDFQRDGVLYPDAIPTLNLPEIVVEEVQMKSVTTVETVIDPSHLFVSLFIDEAGKIINFSLVEYNTVTKWQQDESFEYSVAEIFTNADKSVDKKLGLLGTFFNCSKCQTVKDFGVVVMQKREVLLVPEVNELVNNDDIVEDVIENAEKQQVIHVKGRTPMIEEVSTEELEEPVEYLDTGTKRKLPPLTIPSQTPAKKVQMSFVDQPNNDEVILGIKFFNKRSCNRCGYSPENEELLQNHVGTCRISQLEPCKNPYASKLIGKGGQRIRSSYICSKCTLSILHRDLFAHAEFHIKFAPYACRCSKCFATEEELDEHSRICGQHLFTCKICHKEFVKKRDLYQHKNDVHGLDIHGQPIK